MNLARCVVEHGQPAVLAAMACVLQVESANYVVIQIVVIYSGNGSVTDMPLE